MTRKRRRLYFVGLGLLGLFSATALMLTAVEDNIVFFFSPTELKARTVAPEQRMRVGGLVEEGSVNKSGGTVRFTVTDTVESLTIQYNGILPDLFREGQGIVAEGRMGRDGVFLANDVLAKHDETYMPPEVADALKKSGNWHPEGATAQAAEAKPATTSN
ncbi:MAG: cytochrome c maturation protein CcmE [Rhodospirillaceae bacterium]|nr:cytochrome c maturation protein CcmE [Rhodospirillaceae bacterium]